MDVVLFGIQGSGKGTQAKRLAAEFGYHIFEAGAALRAMAASKSPLGEIVAGYIDQGSLVPFAIIIDVLRSVIADVPADQKILFDGIPRDFDQKKDFDAILEQSGRRFRCIQLALDKDIAIERLRKRATELGRLDDSQIEYIERRIGIFMEKTTPVIDEYAAAGNLTVIDGLGTPDEVYGRIVQALG